MKLKRNYVFRKKNLRGAKVEELYFLMELLKRSELPLIEVVEVLQEFIEMEFGYERVFESDE